MDEFQHDKGGQTDEEAVDKEKIERAKEELWRIGGKAITCCAQWWHQGGGDGYTGNHIALFNAGAADNAGQTAKGSVEAVSIGESAKYSAEVKTDRLT